METIGIFSKLGMPGGSENRVTQLANAFVRKMPTYIFAEKNFSDKLKPLLDPRVVLRENAVSTKRHVSELQGVDKLIIVNSDSYSFCKTSYWNGTQAKHHTTNIDLSQIPVITYIFNYVVSPAQSLVDMLKINKNIRILCTSQWFLDNLQAEKFEKLRATNIPMDIISSPVSLGYDLPKTESTTIRINRHSMGFAYKHDEDNLKVIDALCKKYGDKISFKWMGVPSHVRDVSSDDKDEKVSYKTELLKHPQMQIIPEYSVTVPVFLQEADILFFYISRHRKEPWPRTIAEAMMSGCCCVTNNSFGMAEQIEDGKTGYLFNTTEEAIEKLSKLIEDPSKIRKMGDKAKQFAKDNFMDEVIVDKMLKFMS
jgi:hypothetical protein